MREIVIRVLQMYYLEPYTVEKEMRGKGKRYNWFDIAVWCETRLMKERIKNAC